MSTEYRLPALPFGGPQTTLLRWLKQPGDPLARGEPLLIAVNDRVEALLPAPDDGSLAAVLVADGAQTTAGTLIAQLAAAPAKTDERDAGASPSTAANSPTAAALNPQRGAGAPRRASPVALRIADLSQLDIAALEGSGPGGRIVKSDVLAALGGREASGDQSGVRSVEPPAEAREAGSADPSNGAQPAARSPQPSTLAQPTTMRRAIAAHMVRSRATSPHAMTAMEVDMGRVADARVRLRAAFARRGLDLTYTACIALATTDALLRHPLLNSAWSEAGIIQYRRIHMGIAVALPDGLITPVVRNAQDLNLRGIARIVGDLARRARSRALQPGEASGGTFTITNPGAGAVWFGTPVINQPQVAILGVGAVRSRPLVIDHDGADRIAVRPTALLTLAYDARLCDQSQADAFLNDVKRNLEHFDQ
jgi:2-oxoglutarate dehydrogenase E2 component (dihydrolipoamide succinyltransferase)